MTGARSTWTPALRRGRAQFSQAVLARTDGGVLYVIGVRLFTGYLVGLGKLRYRQRQSSAMLFHGIRRVSRWCDEPGRGGTAPGFMCLEHSA